MSKSGIILILLGLLVLAGCGTVPNTGDTNTDVEAAQSFLPAFAGYATYETSSIQDALVTALGSASCVF